MFGYANNETEHYYPLCAAISNQIMRQYMKVFKDKQHVLSPDAKSQVTFNYTDGKIDTILVAASHKEAVPVSKLRNLIIEEVINPALKQVKLGEAFGADKTAFDLLDDTTNILVNTTGKFVLCGPFADAGIMGRKIVVDSYGGYARIGGGNTHAKCASKSDFTFQVFARYLAKNLVAAGVDSEIEIQLASAIGLPEPVSINVKGRHLTREQGAAVAELLLANVPMTVKNMIDNLHLEETNRLSTNFDYLFGTEPKILSEESLPYYHPWESLDLVDTFKQLFKNI